jgi:anthranilate/para-aminobenzoate synthase component I
VPSRADSPAAVLVRSDYDDCAYVFARSGGVIEGTAADWDRLRSVLESNRAGASDHPHPPGALVGCVAYDGSFRFHVCGRPEVVSTDALLPENAFASPGPGGKGAAWAAMPARGDYEAMVRRIHDYIRAGDIYQVNLARKLVAQVPGFDSHGFFRHLWQATAAPMSAYLDFGDEQLMSASPELFLDVQGRMVRTSPIKGTRPRDPDPLRDQQNAFELCTNPKEIAELIMITDLERNDLAQVCGYGSVRVSDLVRCESYSHVHHLFSTVEGELREGLTALDALRACHPGGSITGAPKKRAMEVIAELEPFQRGFYTGSIGYLGFDGSARFSIAIRTCRHAKGELSTFVGGGITIDSDPAREFEETEHKAAAMRQALERHLGAVPVHAL